MTTSRRKPMPALAFAAVFATVALVLFWLWPRSPIQLSEQGYNVTLALYRVCNQRSEEGLAKVEAQWEIIKRDAQQPASCERSIDEIIRLAKSGKWKEAGVDCRQAMEDQVR